MDKRDIKHIQKLIDSEDKYISYPKWGRMGRMGNMMFELASMYGMGQRYKRKVKLPLPWMYQSSFKHQVEIGVPFPTMNEDANEPAYHFPGWQYWDGQFSRYGDKEVVKVGGWLQSSRYFSKEIAKELFEFTDELKQRVDQQWGIFDKPVIMIGIRVAEDYVKNGNYEILPINYQLGALYRFFPDWRENYNVLVFSDDYQYARLHLSCADNIHFADSLTPIEQMYLGTKCNHFILANSTFNWWQAYLGEKEGSVVVRPDKYFKAYLHTISDTKDLWEPHWQAYNHKGEKFGLKDVAFTIPVKYDHQDRWDNLKLTLAWIRGNFNTNVFLGEQGGQKFLQSGGWMNYINFPDKHFHRTKMLNRMAESAQSSEIVVNFDCDNICPILQVLIGVEMIRKGEADMVYPYDGRVARVDREKWYKELWETGGNFGIFGGTIFRGTRAIDPLSVGHIIMFNKNKFFEGGGENENFLSYGPEDVERFERFEKLGYNIKRVKGIVYHIDHHCGPDSSGKNPYFGKNYDELERIRKMNPEQLRKEVDTWPQTKMPLKT